MQLQQIDWLPMIGEFFSKVRTIHTNAEEGIITVRPAMFTVSVNTSPDQQRGNVSISHTSVKVNYIL
jgi:hypothetical protein